MAETKKVRMLVSRGNPTSGVIIRSGAVVELPAFWAEKFIAEGAAVEETPSAESAKPKKKK